MKKIFLIVNIIILIPILLYISIFFTNNSLAKGIKKNLMAYSLPEKTVLVGSMSKAGKLVGNGNGMQYLGIILVESKITKEQLLAHYSKDFDYVEIILMENISSFDISGERFYTSDFVDDEYYDGIARDDKYYYVACWDTDKNINPFFKFLLDLDLRAH